MEGVGRQWEVTNREGGEAMGSGQQIQGFRWGRRNCFKPMLKFNEILCMCRCTCVWVHLCKYGGQKINSGAVPQGYLLRFFRQDLSLAGWRAWWCTPLIPAGRGRCLIDRWVPEQPGLLGHNPPAPGSQAYTPHPAFFTELLGVDSGPPGLCQLRQPGII